MTSRPLAAISIVFLLPLAAFAENLIQPLSEDLLRVNGVSLYIENITVEEIDEDRISEEMGKRRAVNLKFEGLQDWNVSDLEASYQCQGGQRAWMIPTDNREIWLIQKNWCADRSIRFCLSDKKTRLVCSGWHSALDLKPVKEQRDYEDVRDPFQIENGQTLNWTRSDGSLMRIQGVEKLVEDSKKREEFPTVYTSALLSAVSSVDATLFLGSGQVSYWPKPSTKGTLLFDPQRIGANARFSSSLNSVTLSDGRSLTNDWFDISINYRQKPQGIFEESHIYTFLTYSSYHSLSRGTTRLGGGIGFSFNWPEIFLGWNYPGHLMTYVDFSFLPLDLSGDNRGIIVSSKANGIWLFSNDWFLTGDIELRLLNFTLETENSVIRVQFGGGWAF